MAAELQSAPRAALVAGASGLTGAALLRLLLRGSDYARVHAITRRALPLDHPRLANRILRFEELGQRLAGLRCQDAFCCLGAPRGPGATTPLLRLVDFEFALEFARAALAAGATRLVVVSAAGADAASATPFLRVKGELEAALRTLGFVSLDILQPGAVTGMRAGDGVPQLLRSAWRPLLNPLLRGGQESRRAISGADLAAAMLGAARTQRRGVYCYAGRSLREFAAAGSR